MLANVLRRAGVVCVVVEQRTREHVEQRARAGFVEQLAGASPEAIAFSRRYVG